METETDVRADHWQAVDYDSWEVLVYLTGADPAEAVQQIDHTHYPHRHCEGKP